MHAFELSLERIAAWSPDIAFQNADPRMPGTRGGINKFLEKVRPRVLVPMHLFGETATLADIEGPLARSGTKVVAYGEPGDRVTVTIDRGLAPAR
jgi:hypothetical protein